VRSSREACFLGSTFRSIESWEDSPDDGPNALRASIPEQLLTVPRSGMPSTPMANYSCTLDASIPAADHIGTAVLPSSTSSADATAGSSLVPLRFQRVEAVMT
jgi:hypothetical protein